MFRETSQHRTAGLPAPYWKKHSALLVYAAEAKKADSMARQKMQDMIEGLVEKAEKEMCRCSNDSARNCSISVNNVQMLPAWFGCSNDKGIIAEEISSACLQAPVYVHPGDTILRVA
jgi:hypothetical protein